MHLMSVSEIYGACRYAVQSGTICRVASVSFMVLSEFFLNKFNKSFYTLMIMIYWCISQECYLVEITKLTKYVSAYSFWSDSLFILSPFVFKWVNHVFESLRRECSFRESLHHRIHHFSSIIRLIFSGWFCYHKWDKFESLKSSKTSSTLLTFTTSADCLSILSSSRVYNFRVEIFAFCTLHRRKIRKYYLTTIVWYRPIAWTSGLYIKYAVTGGRRYVPLYSGLK